MQKALQYMLFICGLFQHVLMLYSATHKQHNKSKLDYSADMG